MFEIIDDFCNYDINRDFTENDKEINDDIYNENKVLYQYYKNLPEYEVIVPFTNNIKKDLLLTDDKLNINSIIKSKNFINDILNSYVGDEQLNQQFLLDVNRSKLIINNKLVKSSIAALNYLRYTHGKLSSRIIACATQAICASAFEWIYLSLPNNYHLSELKYGEQRKSVINILDHSISYTKYLRIFNLQKGCDDKTVKKVLLIINIDNAISDSGDVDIQFSIIPQ